MRIFTNHGMWFSYFHMHQNLQVIKIQMAGSHLQSLNSVGLGWVPSFAFLTNSHVIQMLQVQRAYCENQWIGKWVKNSEFILGGWGKFACLGLNVQGCDSYRFSKTFFHCLLPPTSKISLACPIITNFTYLRSKVGCLLLTYQLL